MYYICNHHNKEPMAKMDKRDKATALGCILAIIITIALLCLCNLIFEPFIGGLGAFIVFLILFFVILNLLMSNT